MQYRAVDLGKLKPFIGPEIMTRISPEIEKDIKAFPEVYERIKGCVDFCSQIGNVQQDCNIEEGRKYLRAALAEFASLEDAATIDLPQPLSSNLLKIFSFDDPRLHTVKLLRHANVHLSVSPIEKTSKPASWHGPDGVIEFNYTVIYIPNIRESIGATDQANKYSPSDLDAMISWIEKEQIEWGIDHLILKASELYAGEFLKIAAV